ncbi:MAG TPA: acyl-ACP--UDP-N-acetylglucosamine O-acyltransferase [Thermodesulfobacteriaceae bacterium]|nr:acyl-ACP--UDP-N-acetylglucosamine O-acyltransferase [Thermodesulfobacteriaceae bacterium]
MKDDLDRNIHPTAVISPDAEIGVGVTIGAYAVIESDVVVGSNTEIGPHAVIEGMTTVGKGVKISQFASVGAAPQDLRYGGEATRLEVGDQTIIREFVTLHRGTVGGGGITRVGRQCLLMAYCHIAHDCRLGDHVILANGVTMGGHVEIGDHAVVGGLSAIHQFCRLGEYAFLGGMSGVNKDIPPYVRYWGQRGNIYGLNAVGLKRNGFSREVISALKEAYQMIFLGQDVVADAVEEVERRLGEVPEVKKLVDFIRSSNRGLPVATSDEEGP